MAVSAVRAIVLAANDDVAAVLDTTGKGGVVTVVLGSSGDTVNELTARQEIPFGHKLALHDIAEGKPVHRYGFPIGVRRTSRLHGRGHASQAWRRALLRDLYKAGRLWALRQSPRSGIGSDEGEKR
jgi:hypothetical protein